MAINISELYDAAEKRRLEALQTAQKENSRQLEESGTDCTVYLP